MRYVQLSIKASSVENADKELARQLNKFIGEGYTTTVLKMTEHESETEYSCSSVILLEEFKAVATSFDQQISQEDFDKYRQAMVHDPGLAAPCVNELCCDGKVEGNNTGDKLSENCPACTEVTGVVRKPKKGFWTNWGEELDAAPATKTESPEWKHNAERLQKKAAMVGVKWGKYNSWTDVGLAIDAT